MVAGWAVVAVLYKVAHGHGWGLVTAAMHARWPCFIRVVCMEPTDGHTYPLTYTYTHTRRAVKEREKELRDERKAEHEVRSLRDWVEWFGWVGKGGSNEASPCLCLRMV